MSGSGRASFHLHCRVSLPPEISTTTGNHRHNSSQFCILDHFGWDMMGLSGLGLDLLLCFLDLQMPNLGKYAMKWSWHALANFLLLRAIVWLTLGPLNHASSFGLMSSDSTSQWNAANMSCWDPVELIPSQDPQNSHLNCS